MATGGVAAPAASSSLFLRAASAGDVVALAELCTPQALAAVDADGKSALHCAAFDGQLAAVAWLLERGAALEARTAKGLGPLHYASFKGHLAVVRALTAAGADWRALDGSGRSALHLACTAGAVPVLEHLADVCGADFV